MSESAQRLALGAAVYVAVPAAQARALAGLLSLALREVGRRDGIVPPPDLLSTVGAFEAVASEPPVSAAGSGGGSDEPAGEAGSARWLHDEVTVAEAAALTGWSTSYVCRQARLEPGLARKQGGAWRIDRWALLELVDERRTA